MDARGWLWWFGIALGGLLIAAGVAETVRLLRSGDGGFAFWFGTLVGGGILILVGTLLLPRRPAAGCVLTVMGCLAGLLPTMWTVVVPVLLLSRNNSVSADQDGAPAPEALTLAVAVARRAAATVHREATPG